MSYSGKTPGKNEVANLIVNALRQGKEDVIINAEIQAEIDQSSFKAAETQINNLAKTRKIDVDTSKAEQKLKKLMDPLREVAKEVKEIGSSGADFNVVHNTIKKYEQLKQSVSDVTGSISKNNKELREAQDLISFIEGSIKSLDITVEKASKKRKRKQPQKEGRDIKKQTEDMVEQVGVIEHETVVMADYGDVTENVTENIKKQTEAKQKNTKATLDAAKAQDKLNKSQEKRLKLKPRIEPSGYKMEQAYVTEDGLFEVDKDAEGWKVHRKTVNGMYEVVGVYRTLNDIRRDSALLAEQEAKAKEKLATVVDRKVIQSQEQITDAIEQTTQAIEVEDDIAEGLIDTYEDLEKAIRSIVRLAGSLKPTSTKEYEKVEKLRDDARWISSENEFISEITALYTNVKRIKASIKNGLSVYKHLDSDGDEYELDIDKDTLQNAEDKLKGAIYQGVESFGDAIGNVLDGFKQKRLRSIVESEIDAYSKISSDNELYSEEAKQFNAPIEASIDNVFLKLKDMAGEHANDVDDILYELTRDVDSLNRYTLSSQTNKLGSLLGISTKYDEIYLNSEKIKSYEELCEVVSRYHALCNDSVLYGGKDWPGLNESEEIEREMLRGRLMATADGKDIFKLARFGKFEDIDKLADVLGIKKQIKATTELTSSYEGLAAAVQKYVDASQKLWHAYDNKQDFNAFAEERNAAIEEIVKHFPLDAVGVDANLLRDGYRMALQSQEWSRVYARDGSESTLRTIESGILRARSQMEAEQKRIAEVNKQVTETAKLMGELQDKYGEDGFNKIFADVLNEHGALNVDTANAIYDALIQKEQEYIAEIQRRQSILNEFNKTNQGIIDLYQDSESVQIKVGELAAEIVNGKLTQQDATKLLAEYIEDVIEKEEQLNQEVAETTKQFNEQQSAAALSDDHFIDMPTQASLRDKLYTLKDFTDDELKLVLNGIDLDKLFGDFNIPIDKLEICKKKFIDLLKITRGFNEGVSEDFSLDVFEDLLDDVMKLGSEIKYVGKVYEEFRRYMSKSEIKLLYDDSIKAEYGTNGLSEWSDFAKRNRPYISKNKKIGIPADVLMPYLVEHFGGIFDESDLEKPIQDQFIKIMDVWSTARAELRAPIEQIFDLTDRKAVGDQIAEAWGIASVNLNNMKAMAEAAAEATEDQAKAEKDLANAAASASKSKKKQGSAIKDAIDNMGDESVVEKLFEADAEKMVETIRKAAQEGNIEFLKDVMNVEGLTDELTQAFKDAYDNVGEYKFRGKRPFKTDGTSATISLISKDESKTLDFILQIEDGLLNIKKVKQEIGTIKFDVAKEVEKANAQVDSFISKLKTRKLDGVDTLRELANDIKDSESLKAFEHALQVMETKRSALSGNTVSGKGFNPLANSVSDIENATIHIDTCRKALNRLGDVDGVAQARAQLDKMSEAAERFKNAVDQAGEEQAYSDYSKAESKYKAWRDYAQESKREVDAEVKSVDAEAQEIQNKYKSILDIVNKINDINSTILKYQDKDGGSGMFASYISELQSDKAKLTNELEDISNTISSTFTQGKAYSIPKSNLTSGSDSIFSFLNDAKTQAALTTEEIDRLISALQKSQKIDVEGATKVTERFKDVQEIYKQITSLTNLDPSNTLYQGVENTYRQIGQYLSTLSKDTTEWTPEQSAGLQHLVDVFKEYGSVLVDAGKKEAKYFADKTKYTKGGTTGETARAMKEESEAAKKTQKDLEDAAKSFAKDSGFGDAFITKFTQGADGISKLDFSVFDKASGQLRNFSMEMGSVTDGMFVSESTISKSLANIKAAQAQLGKSQSLIGNLGQLNVGSDSAEVQRLLSLVSQLNTELNQGSEADQSKIAQLTKDSKLATAEVEKLYKKHIQLENVISDGSGQDIGSINLNGNVYKQLTQHVKEFVAANNGANEKIGKFNATTGTLKFTMQATDGTLQEFTVSLDKLGNRAVVQQTAVSELESGWNRFKNSITKTAKQLTTALVGFNIFYKVISMFKQGYQYVKQIDLALTELKKVTNETEESYAKFLQTASKTSSVIGSTISDFTEATANFARLGYSMEEASKMAEAAIVYKNVADGLDSVEESTESIISTMKAFGIESDDVMGIVDRFNEVGNNFAITSAGIGDALQRSASALYEAGNTIDESIALVTAAM